MPPLKILIVDDNTDAADSFATLLGLVGHHTVTAYRGRQALQAAAAEKFDAILLDIGLPDIDGCQVAEMLRKSDPHQIIIAISGYCQAQDVRKAMAAGCSSYLMKPVTLEEFERELSGLLTAVKRNEPAVG